jgi:hypothetical protein
MMRRSLLVAACLASFAALHAQTPADTAKRVNYAYRYRLLGVYDEQTGDPIEGVEVADVINGNKSLTTRTGTVSLLFLPEGGGLVRVRKLGYEVQTIPVSISPKDTTPITVVLAHATQLPTVEVKDSAPKFISPGLRAFEARRKLGVGKFITEDVMRKNEDRTLGDLLAGRIPGVMTVAGVPQRRPSSKFLVSTRKMCAGETMKACQTPNCFVSVYENGVKIYDAANRDPSLIPDVEHMSSRDYSAVEYYSPGEVPAEYEGTGAGCGVLLLWLRER